MIGFTLVAGLLCTGIAPAQVASAATITIKGRKHAGYAVPVRVTVPGGQLNGKRLQSGDVVELAASDGAEKRPGQVSLEGSELSITFLVPELPAGASRTYRILAPRASDQKGAVTAPTQKGSVAVTREGADLKVTIDNTLFTRYTTRSGPNKPFFYPILTPDGDPLTRRWPIEQETGESHDHPHHRGLWFTHGSVNGIDFWTEVGKAGKTIHKEFSELTGGPVFGAFRAATEWRTPEGKQIASDMRTVRVFPLPNGDRLMDFEIVILPTGEPLRFGDTKEGMFGLRVPDALAPARKQGGHIETAAGAKDAAAWGKSAAWVDYWGPVHGATWGIAILDSPKNLRHPQAWHARDYGLFTVNPFGLHDFKLGPEGAGDYTVPTTGSLTLRYRVFFHKGNTQEARVADLYSGYENPPTAEFRGGR